MNKWGLFFNIVRLAVLQLLKSELQCFYLTVKKVRYNFIRINFYLLRTFCLHLGSFLFCFFFHYVSAKFHRWPSSCDLPRPRIGMLSLVTVSPVITAFHSCYLSHHVFDQVNLWPAWVGFETAIFWQCSPGSVETKGLYPLCHGPRRATKDEFFGLINPHLVFQSRVRTEFLYLSLIGIILRWGFLIWELIFIYCGLYHIEILSQRTFQSTLIFMQPFHH